MSVSSLINKHIFDGNALTTKWPYTFPIVTSDGSDLEVFLTNPAGITNQTINFTVDVNAKEVTYPTVTDPLTDPLPDEWQITVIRTEPLTQLLDLLTQGPFNAEVIESALDKLTMIAQQNKEEIDRSLKIGVNYDTGEEETALALGYANSAQAAQGRAENAQEAAEIAQAAAEAAQTAAETITDDMTVAPETNTANYIPQWDGVNSKKLKDGIEKSTDTTLGDNSDEAVPTEKAVKTFATAVAAAAAAAAALWEVDGSEHQLKTADEIDMQSKKILNVADPVSDQDAATKKYTNDQIAAIRAGFGSGTLTPGDALIIAYDPEVSNTGGTYVKKIDITLKKAGIYRIIFELRATASTAYGRIYKNDSPFGTERSDNSQGWVTFSEDLTFAAGDEIELWLRRSTSGGAFARNFRIKCIDSNIAVLNLP